MAGGSATRLEQANMSSKGFYDIQLPSRRTIFQMYFDQINGIRKYVGSKLNLQKASEPLHILIMSSENNHEDVKNYLESKQYFGYEKEFVHVFA